MAFSISEDDNAILCNCQVNQLVVNPSTPSVGLLLLVYPVASLAVLIPIIPKILSPGQVAFLFYLNDSLTPVLVLFHPSLTMLPW